MKVVIVVGGRWHSFDLFRELRALGCEVRIITTYPRFKCHQWGLPDDRCVSLPGALLLEQFVRRLSGDRGFARMQGRVHRLFATRAVKHIGRPDILHGWSSFTLPSLNALRRVREHSARIVVERGSAHIEEQTRILAEESRLTGIPQFTTHPDVVRMELAEYRAADVVQVPSHFVENTFGSDAANRVVRNTLGVNLTAFQPRPAPPATAEPFRVLYVGSQSLRKGIHYLARGFAAAQLPAAELRLVGGAVRETSLLLGITRSGVAQVPHLPQHELINEYQRASVFAIASVEEGLAMVQAQAMACGLPLICTTNTGGEDLLQATHEGPPPNPADPIREYAAGFVVPIRNPEAIAECLRKLHANPALLHAKSAAALNIRTRKLAWADYARRTLELYGQLIAHES
jgi:starch synthase